MCTDKTATYHSERLSNLLNLGNNLAENDEIADYRKMLSNSIIVA